MLPARSAFVIASANLYIETVRVIDVPAVSIGGVRTRIQPTPLQLGSHRLLVPVLDAVTDMIDLRRVKTAGTVARPEICIAGPDFASRTRVLRPRPFVVGNLHPKHARI